MSIYKDRYKKMFLFYPCDKKNSIMSTGIDVIFPESIL